MRSRNIDRIIKACATSDGAGVRLKRSLGQSQFARLDPFLMLDEFGSEEAADYIGGFPPHPHRGFETVTYMLEGNMRHEDHMGNVGHLKSGGVQWMSAAGGIIHSEMPEQEAGMMRGFQLWLNLPAAEKMNDPWYRDIPSEEIPEAVFPGGRVRVIAGRFEHGTDSVDGAVAGISTEPVYLDVHLEPGRSFEHSLPADHNAFVYVYEGAVNSGSDDDHASVASGEAGLLSLGDRVVLTAGEEEARFLLLAGRPLNEPVVQHGPFVMNTRDELEQAMRDYRDGRLARRAEDQQAP